MDENPTIQVHTLLCAYIGACWMQNLGFHQVDNGYQCSPKSLPEILVHGIDAWHGEAVLFMDCRFLCQRMLSAKSIHSSRLGFLLM
jgi:hypothetical protein